MAVNCWQYSREVYLVGRSVKYRPFTEKEREAVISFILSMKESRPAYVDYINLKKDNSLDSSEDLAFQNDYALGKMVQKIGRSLKIQFCSQAEKEECDKLFAATDYRRNQSYNNYVTDETEESSSEQESSSTQEQTSSSTEQTEESSSAE